VPDAFIVDEALLGDVRVATLISGSSRSDSLGDVSELRFSESVVIAADPDDVYDLVADVANMGSWSPVCKECWYDAGAGPTVGSWFTGRNQLPDRTWETRSKVVAADRGREFAWVVNEREVVRWGFTMTEVDGGTKLTQSWEFLPGGHAVFAERFGERADEEIATRESLARTGIPATLAAIKRTAER
jgi:hypothetical protein